MPTPLGPSKTIFSVRSINTRLAKSCSCSRGAPVAKTKSYCSSVLTAGRPANLSKVALVRSCLALDNVKEGLYSGEPMSESFKAQPDIFDATFSGMVAVGERTGNMEEMFESIASYYEDQMDDTIQHLTALLEPVMIVFMGVTIGFILVAMYTPMFQMGQTL